MPNGQKRITVIVKNLNTFVGTIVKGLTLEIVANLKRAASEGGTPVDTGWARANWVAGIGASLTDTVGTREEAEVSGANNAVSEASVLKVAATYSVKQGAVFISNNVPYIAKLNAGSSPQAGEGFVQRAALRAVEEGLARGFRGGRVL